jgi:hypothetical protein
MDKQVQNYGNTAWTPDSGFNFWPDWGPSCYSVEGGQPNGTGMSQPPFWVQPRLGCAGGNRQGATWSCGDGNKGNSPHTGGIQVGLGDGSVRMVSPGVSTATWWFALTPNAGDILGSDW